MLLGLSSDRLEMKFLIVLTLLCAGILGGSDKDILEDVEKLKEMLAKSGKIPLIRIHFFVQSHSNRNQHSRANSD